MPGDSPDPSQMFDNPMQIGVVVADMDRSIKYLSEIFGIGPFRQTVYPPADRPDMPRQYHGAPADFTCRLAFADLGPVELELIQPLEGKSLWRDYLNQHGEGIHHIRYNVKDLNQVTEYLAGKGIDVVQQGASLRAGATWKNFGTESLVGFGIEALNLIPGTSGRTPVPSSPSQE
jgi:methylmalonyl-CoA/ethylmalonyl-CoA epimerase